MPCLRVDVCYQEENRLLELQHGQEVLRWQQQQQHLLLQQHLATLDVRTSAQRIARPALSRRSLNFHRGRSAGSGDDSSSSSMCSDDSDTGHAAAPAPSAIQVPRLTPPSPPPQNDDAVAAQENEEQQRLVQRQQQHRLQHLQSRVEELQQRVLQMEGEKRVVEQAHALEMRLLLQQQQQQRQQEHHQSQQQQHSPVPVAPLPTDELPRKIHEAAANNAQDAAATTAAQLNAMEQQLADARARADDMQVSAGAR